MSKEIDKYNECARIMACLLWSELQLVARPRAEFGFNVRQTEQGMTLEVTCRAWVSIEGHEEHMETVAFCHLFQSLDEVGKADVAGIIRALKTATIEERERTLERMRAASVTPKSQGQPKPRPPVRTGGL